MLNALTLQSAKGLSASQVVPAVSTGWVGSDDFESFANGADIAGGTGGGGWDGAWGDSGSASNKWIATTTGPAQESVAAVFTGSGASKNRTLTRDVLDISVGTVYASVKLSEANVATQIVLGLSDAVGFRCRVRFAGDGTVAIFNGVAYEEKFSALSINTWYRIGIQFDVSGGTTKCNVDGGSFSTATDMEAGGSGDVVSMQVYGNILTSGQSVFVDFINRHYE